MTPDQITALIAAGESETLEFKSTTGTRREAAQTVCGMLNQRGGHVLFGVTLTGDVAGQQVSERTIEEVSAGHCHVNRVGPQRPAWIPFQAAALALSHTLNASFRNRLNVNLLRKCRWT